MTGVYVRHFNNALMKNEKESEVILEDRKRTPVQLIE